MARRSSSHPTELELEVLKVLWREGPQPVRRVQESLAPFRELALTTVTTIMNIMVDKGYLRRVKEGGVYVYHARVSQEKTARGMMRDAVDRLFGGSTVAAMLNLLETTDIKREELEELRRYLERKAREESE